MPPPKTRRPNRHLYRPTSPPHATYAASAQFISPRPPHANLPHRHRVARWIVGPGPVQAFPPRGRPHITGYRRPKPVKSDTRTTVSRDNNPTLRLGTGAKRQHRRHQLAIRLRDHRRATIRLAVNPKYGSLAI